MNFAHPLFITHWFSHHNAASGYDQLARHWLGTAPMLEFQIHGRKKRGFGYRTEALLRALYVKSINTLRLYNVSRYSIPTPNLVHVLYGEMDLPLLELGRHLPVVATFHQPPSYLARNSQRLVHLRKQLANVDTVIALCEDQKEFFQNLIGSKRVYSIPHGIDTTFFQAGSESRKREVLMVGNWLRDWDLAARVVNRLAEMDTQVELRLVNPASDNPVLQNFPAERLHITRRLSDDELLHEYQTCGVVFFSLLASTANNALLEACSCGCRIVAPAVGGISEYAPSSAYLYDPKADVETIATMLLNQLDLAQSIPTDTEAVTHAAKYDWNIIISSMVNIYLSTILDRYPTK